MARQGVRTAATRRSTATGRFVRAKSTKSTQARVATVRNATSRIRSKTVIKSTRHG